MTDTELNNKKNPSKCISHLRSKIVVPGLLSQLIFWFVSVGGFSLDLWTKSAIFEYLKQSETGSVEIINGFFRLVMVLNDGAAFGMASGKRHWLIAASVIAFVGIVVLFLISGKEGRLVHLAMAFFLGGLCGNLYDRIFNDGMVRDFIDVVYWPGRHWPAFNIADAMLCISVALAIIMTLTNPSCQSCQKHDQQQI